jgi:hypothetical protein
MLSTLCGTYSDYRLLVPFERDHDSTNASGTCTAMRTSLAQADSLCVVPAASVTCLVRHLSFHLFRGACVAIFYQSSLPIAHHSSSLSLSLNFLASF